MIGYLVSDAAMELAKAIVAKFEIPEEEFQRVFGEVVMVCKAALVRYEEQADRQNRRVNP